MPVPRPQPAPSDQFHVRPQSPAPSFEPSEIGSESPASSESGDVFYSIEDLVKVARNSTEHPDEDNIEYDDIHHQDWDSWKNLA